VCVFILIQAGAAAAQAQQPAPADDEMDVPDLIRAWRHKPPPPPADPTERMIVAAPIIGSNPTAGFIVGVAAQLARFFGDPATTRISSGIASLSVSTKKQALLNVRFDSFSDGNRWLIEGDNRFQRTSQNIYGFGTATPSSAAVNTDYGFVRIQDTISHRIARDVFLGGGFLFDSHVNVRPADEADPRWTSSPYIAYSEQHGLPPGDQQSTGFSASLLVNRRDNDINARHGWRVETRYRASIKGLLGGDSSWQEVDADARAYLPLGGGDRHRIALWSYANVITKGVAPYFDVPATVMDTYGRSARAYQEGRYRGERLVYDEAEYRGPLMRNGLLDDDGVKPRDWRTIVRRHRTIRGRRTASLAQQAFTDEPVSGLRVGQGAGTRRLPRDSGGVLKVGRSRRRET